MSKGRKLSLALTIIAVLGLAFAVGCRGFFQKPTLTSISINPTAPQVNVDQSLQLEAFGTYNDGSRQQITKGVSWSSGTPSVATIDPNTGVLTGVQAGSSNITASAQALSGTALATVLLTGVTQLFVTPTTAGIGNPGTQQFAFTANSPTGPAITTDNGGNLSISGNPADVTCDVDADEIHEDCSSDGNPGAVGTWTITMTYSGATPVSATLTVNP